MASRRSKQDDPSKLYAPTTTHRHDPLAAQVEKWIGDSGLSEDKKLTKAIWEFLNLLAEMQKMMNSQNGKNIFVKIFDSEETPSSKTPTSNAEKELLIVVKIRNQIYRSFMDFTYHPDNPELLKQLQDLKRSIETFTGVIGKKEANVFQPHPVTKQSVFFSSSTTMTFGGLQEDLKNVLNYLDKKIESSMKNTESVKKTRG